MPRSRNFLLASLMLAASCACARLDAQVTATLTVNGSEPSTSPTTGSIAVSFNGFIEIVNYGQYSTNASLAAGLAAQFSRDYYAYGLGAHASSTGANFVPANANVIYFSLPAGQTFGSIDYTLPNSPFSLVPSGFGTTASLLADTGTVTLSVQGSPVATANYGDGTTPSEIAQKLQDSACTPPAGTVWTFCSPLNPSSPVTLQAVGESLYLTASQPGTSGDISYSIAVAHDTADFPNPSFEFTPSAGLLSGGDAAGPIAPSTVYSYKVETAGGASGYAVNGDLLNLQDSVMGSWQYTYDNLNRLVGASQSGVALANLYPNPSLCWSYDNAGNRLAQAIANQPIAAGTCNLPTGTGAAGSQQLTTYVGESSGATSNRIATIALPGQSAATVQYDGFATPAPGPGNITFDGTNTYLYDLEDRVCAVHGPYGMIGYQYDAEGNRIGKGSITTMSCDITANGYQPQSDYILDQGGDQVTEMAVDAIGTEVWQHTNVWADGQLIATYDTAGQHFYFNDALGTRRYQADASGALEQTCQSLPFGDFLNCTGSNTAPTEHHFTGKERDVESGLDYFGARYYTSATGRFISPDTPFADQKPGNPQSLNLYEYVRNNPLRLIDPTGHGPQPANSRVLRALLNILFEGDRDALVASPNSSPRELEIMLDSGSWSPGVYGAIGEATAIRIISGAPSTGAAAWTFQPKDLPGTRPDLRWYNENNTLFQDGSAVPRETPIYLEVKAVSVNNKMAFAAIMRGAQQTADTAAVLKRMGKAGAAALVVDAETYKNLTLSQKGELSEALGDGHLLKLDGLVAGTNARLTGISKAYHLFKDHLPKGK